MMEFLYEIIGNVNAKLNGSLPGHEAQMAKAPRHRRLAAADYNAEPRPRKSGVLILLYPDEGNVRMALIQRAAYDGVHSGQVSLPGGKFETTDTDLRHTAIRETYEETGVSADDIRVVGPLTELFIPPSNFIVYPFIGYTDKRPRFKPDPEEVEAMIEADIASLLNGHYDGFANIELRNGDLAEVPCYRISGRIVWGATAMIISEFVELLKMEPRIRGFS